ncbi:ATP-binding cassette domain-containing protein [Cellulomonas bogoriensis]|uniref:ATP-binding cassette domain-containing protein n=1 Tax=Cellulomonas bogoriensis TaxID=301388 RepID=UPI002FBE6D4E
MCRRNSVDSLSRALPRTTWAAEHDGGVRLAGAPHHHVPKSSVRFAYNRIEGVPAVDVQLRKVVQGYGRRCVLDNVSLALEPGITALLGPNGAGKSTLMRTLVTDLPVRGGEIVLYGRVLHNASQRHSARQLIGYLPQDFGYDSRFTVQEYVTYLAWLRGVSATGRTRAVDRALDLVALLDHRSTRMGRLSGGMRQRAGIAGAIVGDPSLVVLDEPTVGLDPSQRADFRRVLTRLPASHVLLSTHLTDDVANVAQHVVVLNRGVVQHQGAVADLVANYGSVESGYLSLVGEVEVDR